MFAPEIVFLLARPNITRWVYGTTAILGLLFATISLIVATSKPIEKNAIPLESKNVWLEAKISKEEQVQNCSKDSFGKITCEEPRTVTKIVSEPFFNLRVIYPPAVYEEDTGEVQIFAEQQSTHVLATSNPTNTVEVKLQSGKGITFVQDAFPVAVGDKKPRLSYFESDKISTEVLKRILIQGRIPPPIDKTKSIPKANYQFSDLGSFEVRILPKEMIFGLTESTLKGVQMLFGAMGIPALLLFGVTFFANRIAPKEKQRDNEGSRIILPGEGKRITRRSK